MSDSIVSPSSADRPDLDWSQVRETVLLLHVAVAQIQRSMGDGDDSVRELAHSFTSMAGKAQVIGAAAAEMSEGREKNTVLENCQAIERAMQQAIVAFQFYDQLSQRLAHISHSLENLAGLVANPGRLYNPYEWKGLQHAIRAKYTNEGDRAMFDAILSGVPVKDAIAKSDLSARGDDIELF